MHWKKNRIVHPELKGQIVQTGHCPECGASVKFFYCEHGQVCHACKKRRIEEIREAKAERIEKRNESRRFSGVRE